MNRSLSSSYFTTGKKWLVILTVMFVLSLIPLYLIGFYDHPSVDDYYYSAQTALVWQNTGSLDAVLKASYEEMLTTYQDWQGTYSAIFLMHLQPGLFGENYYVIAPIILISSFVLSMTAFISVLFLKCLKAGIRTSLGIALALTFCALQFTHVPSDSFYWYNGSIYYTFFFSLMLLLFTLIILMIQGKKPFWRILLFPLTLILAFLIGGGNYSTALFTPIILTLLTLWLVIRKRTIAIPVAAVLLVSLIGLGISMIAPGNAIRQASVGGSHGIAEALAYSFAYGGYNIASSTTFPVLMLWIGLTPVLYKISRKGQFRYPYPLLVLLFCYGVFCAQGTPLFYAQGLRMPYRMMNIIYFSYYIFVPLNLIYLLGWISHKYPNNLLERGIIILESSGKKYSRYLSLVLLLFSMGCIGLFTVSETENQEVTLGGMPASISAVYSLATGEASTYDQEMNARNEYLSTTSERDVILEPLSATPYVIFHTDITTDPTHWKNAHMALYYNKASIRLSQ